MPQNLICRSAVFTTRAANHVGLNRILKKLRVFSS